MADRKQERRGLGRGLSALMADVRTDPDHGGDAATRGVQTLPVEKLVPNPDQPRQSFSDDKLNELASSIREKGVIQPLIVRELDNNSNTYEIVAGERRWRAAQIAQVHSVPVLVREFTDAEVLEVAIIENVQRADLNPVDEANGYRQLVDRFGHTQEKLAQGLSKSRSHIANLMRLLQLPDDVQDLLRSGALSAGHARALITTADPSGLASQVVRKGLSVRQTERLAKGKGVHQAAKPAPRPQKDADTIALEGDLSANMSMKVTVEHKADLSGGQVVIRYGSLDELDEICRVLSATR